jgi:hypothetical protein
MSIVAGTNLASVRTAGTTAGTGSNGSNRQIITDPAQQFAYVAMGWGQHTTIAAGIVLPQTSITVAATTQLLNSGWVTITTNAGPQLVSYTGTSGGTTLTGCSGGTGTTTASNVFQSASIAKIQLSNMTISSLQWGVFPTVDITAIFYDSVNSQIVALATGAVLYGLPISGGNAGTAVLLNGGSTITNITFASNEQFIYDSAIGVVWEPNSGTRSLFGFYYQDPTGYHADFTPVNHAASSPTQPVTAFLSKGGLRSGRIFR